MLQFSCGVLDLSGSYSPFSPSSAGFPKLHLMFGCGRQWLLTAMQNLPYNIKFKTRKDTVFVTKTCETIIMIITCIVIVKEIGMLIVFPFYIFITCVCVCVLCAFHLHENVARWVRSYPHFTNKDIDFVSVKTSWTLHLCSRPFPMHPLSHSTGICWVLAKVPGAVLGPERPVGLKTNSTCSLGGFSRKSKE